MACAEPCRFFNSLFVGKHSHSGYGMILTGVMKMERVRIGRFLAELRHGEKMTQEALAEKVGVTNKTISRWENGNYMPDIEMLQFIGQVFDVSMDELLAGRRLSEKGCRTQKDQNASAAVRESIFSPDEQRVYWKRKWRCEHRARLVCLAVAVSGLLVVPWLIRRPLIAALAPLAGMAAYGYQNNRMMAYVENQLYGLPDNKR